jgi:peptidoglycan/LPS O-acetylase OafA/YrhL
MQGKMRERLDGIESLRAYAAVSIIMFHLIGSGGIQIPEALSFIGTHFGQGVPLFFVVSGFSLAYGYMGRLRDEAAIQTYYRRRFFRIAPLFYAALAFQLLWLWHAYGVTFRWTDIALNATFLFNFVPRLTDGIVPASWTIGVEMLFYAIFPALLLWCTNLPRTLLALALSTLAAGQFGVDTKALGDQMPAFVYHNFLKNLPLFMWGVAAFHVLGLITPRLTADIRRYVGWVVVALAIGGLFLLYHWQALYMYFWALDLRSVWDTLWGVPFGLLCVGLAVHPTRVISNPMTRYVGQISFSVYIVHANILWEAGRAGLFRWVFAQFAGQPVLAYFASLAIALAMILPVAAITYRLIEVPGMNWGKRHRATPSVVPATA